MDELQQQENCPNCDFPLSGEVHFCPSCGQKVLNPSDFTFRHLFLDSIGDYFHVDGKFLHTLKPLLFKPGLVTSDYIEGRRARFIPPFKLFLFISVIYFIAVGLTFSVKEHVGNENVATADTSKANSTAAERDTIDLKLALTIGGKTIPVDSARKVIEEKGMDAFLESVHPGSSWFTRFIERRAVELSIQGSQAFIAKMVHNASKAIFLLIPFVALLLKIIYLRRKRLYHDHLIFSLHFHSFLFLLLLVYQLLAYFLFETPVWIMLMLVLIYLSLSLKQVYNQRWWKTILKMTVLLLLYLIIALPAFAVVLFLVSAFL